MVVIAVAASCLGQGVADDMLRATLVYGQMDMEDDLTEQMVVTLLLARYGGESGAR